MFQTTEAYTAPTGNDDDVSFYNSTASTWTLATPRTTWESNRNPYDN